MSGPPEAFTCVDCGGTAHLITHLPEEDELEPGMPLAYRCGDCWERFDVIWDGDEDE